MLSIINIIFGAALLVAGRRLFWLFVMAGGFVAGVQFATSIIKGPEWLTIIFGLAVGIAFAILARFFQTLAIGIAGFFLGGSIFSAIAGALGLDINWISWIVGGLIGIVLVSVLFDWALIGLSSFSGAALLVQALNLSDAIRGITFIILLIAGIFIQVSSMGGEKKVPNESIE
ncbi:MAG: hypothetical protein Q8L41_15235 [Anaerolineales bacterium]|nr:hypothetical protein [Anaerolineales bacterium]